MTMITQSTKLLELKAKQRALNDKLHTIFEEAGPDYDFSKIKSLLEGDTAARVGKVHQMNAELSDLNDEIKKQEDLEGVASKVRQAFQADREPALLIPHPRGDGADPRQTKSIGRLFVESAEYQQYRGQRNWPSPVNLPGLDFRATVFRTGAGWDPEVMRLPGAIPSAQRPIAVIDAVPMLPTDQSSINFMEETTFTNNAVETAESTATTASDLIGEAALALTERTNPVELLPVFIPVTLQQMEDEPGVEAYVNGRLVYMIRARLDSQILAGNGTTPNLKGTKNIGGSLQTQAKGGDPTPDAVYKLFTKLRVTGFVEPSVVFFHPNDWQDIRLLRTADGIYIFGSPMDAGPDRIWGVPVIQTTANAENTAVAGDYQNFSALYTKRGVTLAVSDSHGFYFTRMMMAIRADMRVAMVHFRTSAFGTVTGI